MDIEERQEFASPLPVLARLDRLDLLLQLLEERQSLSQRHASCSLVRKMEPKEDECKSLSSALEEVHHKGTLMDRLERLENRLLQLSLNMDVGSMSRSSSSTNVAHEKIEHGAVSTTVTMEDGLTILTHQEKQDYILTQEKTCAEECVKNSRGSQKGKRSKKYASTTIMRRRKWLGWFRMEC